MNEQNVIIKRQVDLPHLEDWGNDTWRDRANCKNVDTNIFFPTKEDLGPHLTARQKKAIIASRDRNNPDNPGNQQSRARLLCVKCPVRKECLSFALRNKIVHGMYGGIPPRERRGLDPNNPDTRIPFKLVLVDLYRVCRLREGMIRNSLLAKDLADLLNISYNKALQMIRDHDFPEFV